MSTSNKTEPQFLSTTEAANMLGVSTTMVQSLVDKQELQAWKTRGGHRRIALQSILDLQRNLQVRESLGHKFRNQPKISVAVESPDLYQALQQGSANWSFSFDFKLLDSITVALLSLPHECPDMLIAEMAMSRSQQESIMSALEDLHIGRRRTSITFVAPQVDGVDMAFGDASAVRVVPGPLTPTWLEAFLTGVQATMV